MSFTNLTTDMQNLLLVQSDQQLKFLFFFFTIVLSAYYLFWHKKNYEKETPFFSLGMLRLVATLFSYIFLLLSPLAFIFLSPQVSFLDLYLPYLWIYLSILAVTLFVVAIDFIYYTPLVFLKWAGIKYDNKYVQKVDSMMSKIRLR
jgi:hypothetical protein